ncbi:MAG: 30S ribosomal protein S2 [Candidatus Peregrinibacteria bacterium]
MTDISLIEMVKSAVHFGHPKHRWNPKMRPYIYGLRHGVHVFDLKKTAQKLVEALEFLSDTAKKNQTILFVGTKQQCRPMLLAIQKASGMPVVTDKWIPGFLTNFKTIRKRVDYFKDLKESDAKGDLDKYTKKEQMKLRKKIQDMSTVFTGVEEMEDLPHVVFVTDIMRDHIPVQEARRLKIPVVGITDTNADPDLVDYVIPANDDAIKSLEYILGLVKEAVSGKKK